MRSLELFLILHGSLLTIPQASATKRYKKILVTELLTIILEPVPRGNSICIELEYFQEETGQFDGTI